MKIIYRRLAIAANRRAAVALAAVVVVPVAAGLAAGTLPDAPPAVNREAPRMDLAELVGAAYVPPTPVQSGR